MKVILNNNVKTKISYVWLIKYHILAFYETFYSKNIDRMQGNKQIYCYVKT